MSATPAQAAQSATSRGETWLAALGGNAARLPGYPASVQVADVETAGRAARLIAVVPDAASPFPRARQGEVGLLEGWSLARAVHEAVAADRDRPVKRAIVAIVDTPSQAYGRREEAFGIHQALASAAAAYATARLQGHPVIALLVGKAMSGAFLAHGYQANRILALRDPGVQVHAMGKEAAARITLRSVEDLEAFAATVPPMAYDLDNYATLGLLWRTIAVHDAAAPNAQDLAAVQGQLAEALADIDADPQRDLRSRLQGENRGATRQARALLASQWQDKD
ncbi:biotin-independent malonate decarboxylase subunit gamma [Cupriavidus sp. D384]|uniref:biotin-independent malonate decarboxylase subunit gamma n=1 Tax=Cupriavidus sp. D384 TaxID=1538095 RepID=UPI00082D939C|nr:biotin-independent malonate decarboxylase subunit gamma [Cupriavidus sp. D384]